MVVVNFSRFCQIQFLSSSFFAICGEDNASLRIFKQTSIIILHFPSFICRNWSQSILFRIEGFGKYRQYKSLFLFSHPAEMVWALFHLWVFCFFVFFFCEECQRITGMSPVSSAKLHTCQLEKIPGCFSFPAHAVLLFTPFILILVRHAVPFFFSFFSVLISLKNPWG